MSDFKIAGMATINERAEMLRETVDSIIEQVDVLMIYMNDYDIVPGWLRDHPLRSKINLFGSIDRLLIREVPKNVNQGDRGKFYTIPYCNGYYFSIDDDLIYPSDYIDEMILSIESFARKAIITNHGRNLPDGAIKSFYKDSIPVAHFNRALDKYCPVHVGGTGVMGFHTDYFTPDIMNMEVKNMADIYVADQAQKEERSIIVRPHPEGWIKENPELDQKRTIFARNRTNDYYQTKLINRRKSWQLNPTKLTM